MIENIEIGRLCPHPKNPRKDVGDITELSESIKVNGVMQNLTVVPIKTIPGSFYVVIGNRRLAASKLAGLTELPCVISSMDKQTQQSTMLLENMQRVDLTPYEQAEGFQMCLDLGMNEDVLKEKTGFSKATIKHRLQLLKLDKEKFKKGVDRGATLQDYIDLEQIENEATKNDLLGVIGTKDYRYKLNNEITCQSEKKATSEFIERLKEVMTRVEARPDGYRCDRYLYGPSSFKNYTIPEDLEKCKYVFTVQGGRSIEIFKEELDYEENKSKIEEPKEPTQEELDVMEIKKKTEAAYRTRLEFAKSIYQSSTNDVSVEFGIKYAFDIIADSIDSNGYDDDKIFEQVTGKVLKDLKLSDLCDTSMKMCVCYLFALIYAILDNTNDDLTVQTWTYNDSYGKYRDSNKEEIITLYGFLEYYGYQSSEEEKAIMFGTHPLYVKEDKEGA